MMPENKFDNAECNLMLSALMAISKAKEYKDVYDYLDKTPITCLIAELVEELHNRGYSITKNV